MVTYLLITGCSCGWLDERAERMRPAPGSGKDEGLKYVIHFLSSVTMFS
jgi:hypothetical protein